MIDRLTIAFPYWESPAMLREHLRRLAEWPDAIRSRVTVLICDDCSARYPADAALVAAQPFDARLYRITRKAVWNYRAAKNIAMHEAPEGWALLTDIDHVLSAAEAGKLFQQKLDPTRVYDFDRVGANGERVRPVQALRLMTRAMYWKFGGFDESYAGTQRGGGKDLLARIYKAAGKQISLPVKLTRYSRSVVGDEPDGLARGETPEEDARVLASWEGVKVLTFPYERLA